MEEKKKASRKKIKEKKDKKEKKESKKRNKKESGPSLIEDSIGNPEHDVLLNEDHKSNSR